MRVSILSIARYIMGEQSNRCILLHPHPGNLLRMQFQLYRIVTVAITLHVYRVDSSK